jgi:hypothetical protein
MISVRLRQETAHLSERRTLADQRVSAASLVSVLLPFSPCALAGSACFLGLVAPLRVAVRRFAVMMAAVS